MKVPSHKSAFTLMEVLVALAIMAILMSILLPLLSQARDVSYRMLCAGNLKQVGVAWHMYLRDHGEFPKYGVMPDWHYGGVVFRGDLRKPMLASDRPINSYVAPDGATEDDRSSLLFRCPSDIGIHQRDVVGRSIPGSILPDERTCFEFFGTSYRANGNLLGTGEATNRPLKLSEIDATSDSSNLLLMGDAAWYFATRDATHQDAQLAASWHDTPDAGNMVAVDGSVRYLIFATETGRYTLRPLSIGD